jgi:PAS domain S-box-containing protein
MIPAVDLAAVFDAVPDACLVLDVNLVMVTANQAYLDMTGTTRAQVQGRRIPEVFPVNPEDAAAMTRLESACTRVLRTGQPHRMGVIRYDLVTDDPAVFDTRFWNVTIAPVPDADGTVTHLVHRGRNVTDVHPVLLRVLATYCRELGAADDADLAELLEVDADTAATGELVAALVAEVEQMWEAMASRATIEQAKGMLMSTLGCGPDTAFDTLRRQSQDTNVKLRTVAETLVGSTSAAPVRSAVGVGSPWRS